MKPIFLFSVLGMSLAACTSPSAETESPASATPSEVVLSVENLESPEGFVEGEEEIEVVGANDEASDPIMPSEMAGVPVLTADNYVIKPVSDLNLKGTESAEAIGRLLRKRYGVHETVDDHDEELEVFEDGANAAVVFTLDGLADDSVKAMQHVVQIFFPAAVPAGVTGYGVRYKCYRAADPEAWQNTVCP